MEAARAELDALAGRRARAARAGGVRLGVERPRAARRRRLPAGASRGGARPCPRPTRATASQACATATLDLALVFEPNGADPAHRAAVRLEPLARGPAARGAARRATGSPGARRSRSADLAGERWALAHGRVRGAGHRRLRGGGLHARPAVFASGDYAAVQGFVAAGGAVALVPALAAARARADLAVRPLVGRGPGADDRGGRAGRRPPGARGGRDGRGAPRGRARGCRRRDSEADEAARVAARSGRRRAPRAGAPRGPSTRSRRSSPSPAGPSAATRRAPRVAALQAGPQQYVTSSVSSGQRGERGRVDLGVRQARSRPGTCARAYAARLRQSSSTNGGAAVAQVGGDVGGVALEGEPPAKWASASAARRAGRRRRVRRRWRRQDAMVGGAQASGLGHRRMPRDTARRAAMPIAEGSLAAQLIARRRALR